MDPSAQYRKSAAKHSSATGQWRHRRLSCGQITTTTAAASLQQSEIIKGALKSINQCDATTTTTTTSTRLPRKLVACEASFCRPPGTWIRRPNDLEGLREEKEEEEEEEDDQEIGHTHEGSTPTNYGINLFESSKKHSAQIIKQTNATLNTTRSQIYNSLLLVASYTMLISMTISISLALSEHQSMQRTKQAPHRTQIFIYATNDNVIPATQHLPPTLAAHASRSIVGHKSKRAAVGTSSSSSDVNVLHGHSGNSSATSAKLQLEVDALAYLQRYGYMNETTGNAQLISEDSFHEAVVTFQRFAGIPETGSIDNLTVKYMQMPRCGNKDQSGKGENGRKRRRRRRRRRKRYALQGSKWRRQELTYRISQYPTRFMYKKHEVDGQIERAFKIWSQVAPIDFVVKREGRVHIDIRFASGEHGDGDPFDGPGNTLAHAYFPQYGGDAHFDDQEYWTVDSYAGTNIFQVAAHELGHSLGLGHSSVREALMAPFYQKYKPNFKLHADDVLAIQALYGEKQLGGGSDSSESSSTTPTSISTTSTSTSTTTTTSTNELPGRSPTSGAGSPIDLCQEPQIDAITRVEDGSTYVFRGQWYWLIKNEGLASGYPARISRDWDGLPGNLDAALTWSDGKTFFFKGDKYWRFTNKRREPGYPKLISAGFAGIPNNLDAAFVWSGNGKTYFFKKDKYWRFDSKQEPPVSSQYPKSIKNWSGLPTSGLDAAFKWENGMTYFFKDDQYWRFDDREFEVDTVARPAFPRSTSEWWFGCTNNNLPLLLGPTTSSSSSSNTAAAKRTRIHDIHITNNSNNDDDTNSAESQGSAFVLHHNRKPNVSHNEPVSVSTTPTSSRPAGSSISRSILSSLSALFPSSISGSGSSSTSASSSEQSNSLQSGDSNSKPADDWSYHRGIGEEVRRLAHGARPAPGRSRPGAGDQFPFPGLGRGLAMLPPALSSAGADAHHRRPAAPESRWSFPTGARGETTSRGEQSMSELKMQPSDAADSR